MCETYPPERYFISVFTFIYIGVPPFSVREDSLLNSKHISPERYFVSVFTFIHIGVPPFPVREDSLLNSKHISPERYFVSVFTFIHIGVPPFSVREDSLLNSKHISPECNLAIVRTNTSYPLMNIFYITKMRIYSSKRADFILCRRL